jgi:threonine dehydratase
VLQERGARGVAVSEAEVRAAVRFAWHELELRVEPGGAAALAAVLARKVELLPRTVVMLTGGNMDAGAHAEWVA